jgi:hypothetical protein
LSGSGKGKSHSNKAVFVQQFSSFSQLSKFLGSVLSRRVVWAVVSGRRSLVWRRSGGRVFVFAAGHSFAVALSANNLGTRFVTVTVPQLCFACSCHAQALGGKKW